MLIRDLRMLRRLLVVSCFVRLCGVPMRLSRFFVMRGCFVMIVFWHVPSASSRAFHWPFRFS